MQWRARLNRSFPARPVKLPDSPQQNPDRSSPESRLTGADFRRLDCRDDRVAELALSNLLLSLPDEFLGRFEIEARQDKLPQSCGDLGGEKPRAYRFHELGEYIVVLFDDPYRHVGRVANVPLSAYEQTGLDPPIHRAVHLITNRYLRIARRPLQTAGPFACPDVTAPNDARVRAPSAPLTEPSCPCRRLVPGSLRRARRDSSMSIRNITAGNARRAAHAFGPGVKVIRDVFKLSAIHSACSSRGENQCSKQKP